jgi:nuclear transport factor 2 (NTF2) superfamily protein
MIAGYDPNNMEFRRSEVRFRLEYMKALSDFIWVGAQVGYIYAYRFNVDSGNDYRSFGADMPYVMENEMTGAPYFQITLNLVSP